MLAWIMNLGFAASTSGAVTSIPIISPFTMGTTLNMTDHPSLTSSMDFN